MAEGASAGTNLAKNLTELVDAFAGVATNGPLSAVLLVIGALVVTVSVGAFGYLTAGAVVELVTPERGGRQPQRG